MFDGVIRVFVSYSHDSPEHVERVVALVQRLRDDGIDAQVDRFVASPPMGWPSWMHEQIQVATFVLVVCTPGYASKLSEKAEGNRGLGAKWEGAIISTTIYEAGGRNDKFIPIVFAEDDVEAIPHFLRVATRYNVADDRGFLALYRHLTDQPQVIPQPLGNKRELPSDVPPTIAAGAVRTGVPDAEPVLLSGDAGAFVVPARQITAADTVTFELVPQGHAAAAFLADIGKSPHASLAVAYGSQAGLSSVEAIRSVRKAGVEVVTLTVRPRESDYGSMMEMATTGHSAEAIAEKRVRRILLDEKLAPAFATDDKTANDLSDAMLEVLVRGVNVPLSVSESPLPALYQKLAGNTEEFLVTARLVCILYLRLSGAIERTLRLDLSLKDGNLRIDFEGLRAKKYSNVDAHRIVVAGTLRLVP